MAAFDSLLSDPYLSNLLSSSSKSRRRSSMTKPTSTSPPGPVPNLIQFLESVPPPVTLLLVELAPFISYLRRTAEVLSWNSHWTESWLALAGWWALCLTTNAVLRYLLPLVLLLPALLPYMPSRRKATSRTAPTTEHSITIALSDITIVQTLLPTLPNPPSISFSTALRISAFLYLPYIIITYFVPMPILLGVAGTLLFTYRAPWARTIRTVLGRSAYVQYFLLRLWIVLSGSPSSEAVFSRSTTQQSSLAVAPASPSTRFLFTILECHRWWMGLDWTAALLPGERPSWCSLSHQPVSPPSAFSLPPPSSVFLAAPNGKRVKRTAAWRWEESEWGIWVNKDGKGGMRIERVPPGLDDEDSSGAKIATRAAIMLKERTASITSINEITAGKDDRESGSGSGVQPELEPDHGEALSTDADGWIYGDNKWEAPSAKGGMGKYTRYRRWTRVAVLEETVEEVGPGELGILKETENRGKEAAAEQGSAQPNGDVQETSKASDASKREIGQRTGRGEDTPSPLRERLKSAMKAGKA